MPFPSLPLDVLLVILRDVDVVDVVRTGMVSGRSLTSILTLTIPPRNVTDLQSPLRGHTGPLHLERSARKVASERTNAQVCHASARFPLRARVENIRHWLGQVTPPLGQGWRCGRLFREGSGQILCSRRRLAPARGEILARHR